MYKKLLLLPVVLIMFYHIASAQSSGISINTTGARADTSALLDISSVTKGFLTPRMTGAQKRAIYSPAIGLLVFQTDSTPGFRYYNGTQWIPLSSATNGWQLNGNTGTSNSNFIGTTDNTPLRFKTNNIEGMRLDSLGNLGIGTNKPTHLLDVAGSFDLQKNALNVLYTDNAYPASGINYAGAYHAFPGGTRVMLNGVSNIPFGSPLSGTSYTSMMGFMGQGSNQLNLLSIDTIDITLERDSGLLAAYMKFNKLGMNFYNGNGAINLFSNFNLSDSTLTFYTSNSNVPKFVEIAADINSYNIEINRDSLTAIQTMNDTSNSILTANGGRNSYILQSPSSLNLSLSSFHTGQNSQMNMTDTSVTYTGTPNIYIGIGTNAPAYRLDVVGSIRATNLSARGYLIADNNGQIVVDTTSGGGAWFTKGNSATNPLVNFIGTKDNHSMVFKTNNTEVMRLDSTGNLGIGLTKPTHTLEVNGTFQLQKNALRILYSDNIISHNFTSNIKYVGAFHPYNDSNRYNVNGIAYLPGGGFGTGYLSLMAYLAPSLQQQNFIGIDSNNISLDRDSAQYVSRLNLSRGVTFLTTQNSSTNRSDFVTLTDSSMSISVTNPNVNLSSYTSNNYNSISQSVYNTILDKSGNTSVNDTSLNLLVTDNLNGIYSHLALGDKITELLVNQDGAGLTTNFVSSFRLAPLNMNMNVSSAALGIGSTFSMDSIVNLTTSHNSKNMSVSMNYPNIILNADTNSTRRGNLSLSPDALNILINNTHTIQSAQLNMNDSSVYTTGGPRLHFGVGTNAPAYALDVSGSIRASNLTTSGHLIADSHGQIRIDSTPGGSTWFTQGNTGTAPNTNFIGTTDNQSMIFKTHNIEVMRLDSLGNLGIGLTKPNHSLEVKGSFDQYRNGLHLGSSDDLLPVYISGIKFAGVSKQIGNQNMLNGIISIPGNPDNVEIGFLNGATNRQITLAIDSQTIALRRDSSNASTRMDFTVKKLDMNVHDEIQKNNAQLTLLNSDISTMISDTAAHATTNVDLRPLTYRATVISPKHNVNSSINMDSMIFIQNNRGVLQSSIDATGKQAMLYQDSAYITSTSAILSSNAVNVSAMDTSISHSTNLNITPSSVNLNTYQSHYSKNTEFTLTDSSAFLTASSGIANFKVGANTSTPNSRFQVKGSFATTLTYKITNYTATIDDNVITANAALASDTITLPSAVGITGRQYTVKRIDNSPNTMTVNVVGGGTIDGLTSQYLNTQWKYITVISDGTNWFIIANN